MRLRFLLPLLLLGLVTVTGCSSEKEISVDARSQPHDWRVVESIFGRKGTVDQNVFKLTFPRADLRVVVGDVAVDPELALTSWIALQPHGERETMLMGDLVLTEREVDAVTSRLLGSGLQVTALHNHLLGESPRIMFLHIAGQGEPVVLAQAVKGALSETRTPLVAPQVPPAERHVDWQAVQRILGRAGHEERGILHFSIPRAETIVETGMPIPPAMGVATVINLQAVGSKAATTGDFVLVGSEVNPVTRTLREHGISVTAIHNHMLTETPRLFFLHFWGYGDPQRLARGLRLALDQTNSVRR